MQFVALDSCDQVIQSGKILAEVPKKWLSRDPLESSFPDKSPYNFVSNNPINRIDPDGRADYYVKDGNHVYNDEVKDDKTMLISESDIKRSKGGEIIGMTFDALQNATDLKMKHRRFQVISSVIKLEASPVLIDKDEFLWLAHVANNEAKARKSNIYKILMSGYSSVSKKNKVPMRRSSKSRRDRYSRAGVISVLRGHPDPTGGARRWDGTDFLAWGLKSPYGKNHAKFRQFGKIYIDADILNRYRSNTMKHYKKGRVKYSGRYYYFDAPFNDPEYLSDGAFLIVNNTPCKFINNRILWATGAKGGMIFWAIER